MLASVASGASVAAAGGSFSVSSLAGAVGRLGWLGWPTSMDDWLQPGLCMSLTFSVDCMELDEQQEGIYSTLYIFFNRDEACPFVCNGQRG